MLPPLLPPALGVGDWCLQLLGGAGGVSMEEPEVLRHACGEPGEPGFGLPVIGEEFCARDSGSGIGGAGD